MQCDVFQNMVQLEFMRGKSRESDPHPEIIHGNKIESFLLGLPDLDYMKYL